jgi:cytochrome c-type biogenesis protein CcmH
VSAIWPLWASAVALLLLAIAALIWPLLRESADAPGERGAADAELRRVYQAQRRELEAEFERQMLAPADREQALEELQRRLLDDTDALQPGGTSRTSPVAERMWMRRGLAGLLAVALPVAALALYLKVGDPQAAATAAAAEPQSHASSGIDVDTMIGGLAAKLAQTPDDLEGWVVLARSHEVQEDFAKASDAYRHAIGAAERGQFPAGLQARLHADLADALASDQGGAMGACPAGPGRRVAPGPAAAQGAGPGGRGGRAAGRRRSSPAPLAATAGPDRARHRHGPAGAERPAAPG